MEMFDVLVYFPVLLSVGRLEHTVSFILVVLRLSHTVGTAYINLQKFGHFPSMIRNGATGSLGSITSVLKRLTGAVSLQVCLVCEIVMRALSFFYCSWHSISVKAY